MPPSLDALLDALKPAGAAAFVPADLDSLAILTLVTRLEAAYGIMIAPEDLVPANFESVDAIRALVRRHGADG